MSNRPFNGHNNKTLNLMYKMVIGPVLISYFLVIIHDATVHNSSFLSTSCNYLDILRRVRATQVIPAEGVKAIEDFIISHKEDGRFFLTEILETFSQYRLTPRYVRGIFKRLILEGKIPPFIETLNPETGNLTGVFMTMEIIHRDLNNLHRSTDVLLMDREGNAFIFLRGLGIPMQGRWNLSGGHVYVGEDYREAAVRWVSEETGFMPDPARLQAVKNEGNFSTMGAPQFSGNNYSSPTSFMYHLENEYNNERSSLYVYVLNDEEISKVKAGKRMAEFRQVNIEEEIERLQKNPNRYTPNFIRYFLLPELSDEVEANYILSFYPVGKVKAIKHLNAAGLGIHKIPIKVETESGSYVLSNTLKTTGQILFEKTFLIFFRDKGLPFHNIIRRSDVMGLPADIFEEYYYFFQVGTGDGASRYVLYDYIDGNVLTPGTPTSNLNSAQRIEATRTLAQFHWVALDGFVPRGEYQSRYNVNPRAFQNNFDSIKSEIENAIIDKKITGNEQGVRLFLDNYQFLVEQVRKFQINFSRSKYDALPQGPTHGDFTRFNLVFKGNKVVGIIDYENIGMDTKLWDIITWVISARSNHHSIKLEEVKDILKTYNRTHQLSIDELKFFPQLLGYKILAKINGFLNNASILFTASPGSYNYDYLSSLINTLKDIDKTDWEQFIKDIRK
jgi:thiamine kinase-like enzyme/8-oxo-dGTP pyrophosphatase MutT (NUDIX family)